MRRKKDSLWIQFLFLFGIISGTLLGIWLREWLTEQIAVYQSLFSLQISHTSLWNRSYFYYLLRNRLVEVAALFFAVYAGWYLKFLRPLSFFAGFWIGVILTGMTFLYGIKGMLLFAADLFPHFLMYGFGCLLLYEFAYKRSRFQMLEQIKIAVQIFLLFAVGIICEWGIQPVIMKLTGI